MDTQTLTLSSVGQITIPRSLRRLLNLNAGDKLDVSVNPDTRSITIKKQPTFDEIMAEMDEIDKKYPTPPPDPRYKNMSVGEISLEMAKNIKGDTWV